MVGFEFSITGLYSVSGPPIGSAHLFVTDSIGTRPPGLNNRPRPQEPGRVTEVRPHAQGFEQVSNASKRARGMQRPLRELKTGLARGLRQIG